MLRSQPWVCLPSSFNAETPKKRNPQTVAFVKTFLAIPEQSCVVREDGVPVAWPTSRTGSALASMRQEIFGT